MLSPNVDVYGTYARLSALADYLEVQAIQRGQSMTKAALADLIGDNSWIIRLEPHVVLPGTDEGEATEETEGGLGFQADRASESATRVFDLLRERAAVLGGLYPFEVKGERLRREIAWESKAYIRLLALTLCHAYDLVQQPDPRTGFEEVLRRVFQGRGFLSANFGDLRRGCGSFEESLALLDGECELRTTPERSVYRRRAQDEGVDVVAHFSWSDYRQAQWVIIGQATCAKSDRWKEKLLEASPSQWMRLLGIYTLPRAVLAVPHHIPDEFLRFLVEQGSSDRLILDRLRLSQFLGEPAAFEQSFVKAILENEVEV